MAVGDIVNSISSVNTVLVFQPAAGVEVMITFLISTGGIQMTDGTINSRGVDFEVSDVIQYSSLKVFVKNTLYCQLAAVAGTRTAYTGITIK